MEGLQELEVIQLVAVEVAVVAALGAEHQDLQFQVDHLV